MKRVNIRKAVVFANNAAERTTLHVLPTAATIDSRLQIGGKHRSLFNRLSVCLSISLCERYHLRLLNPMLYQTGLMLA